jgi:hypothetical protein
VLPLERDADGSLGAWIGEDSPDAGSTGADGCITIRYTSEPRERLFGILEDRELVEAVNAEPAGTVRVFKAFRAGATGPVRFVFRDPEGTVFLRPVDAITGEVLCGWTGIACVYTFQEPGEAALDMSDGLAEHPPGWLQGRDWTSPSVRDLRLLVPGYLPAPAPEGGWKGRVVVRLKKDPAAVRGRIVVPNGWEASADLLRASDGHELRDADFVGIPERAGAFAMSGIPPGEWELVVQAWKKGTPTEVLRWAVRRFEFRGAGIDLGDLVPSPGAVVRARLVSRDGDPGDGGPLLLAHAVPGATPLLVYRRGSGGCSVAVQYFMTFLGREPGTKDPDDDGWVEFQGLRPGAPYLLATPRVPGLTKSIEAPKKPGQVLIVELDGRCATTTCVLRFTVEGEEPKFWQGIMGPAYAEDFSTGKGTLEAEIPPGRYRFLAQAALGEDADYDLYAADVDIPDSGRFETTVDLKPRKP